MNTPLGQGEEKIMSDEQASETEVEVSEVKHIDFYGDEITAVQAADGEIYVPLRPLTEVSPPQATPL